MLRRLMLWLLLAAVPMQGLAAATMVVCSGPEQYRHAVVDAVEPMAQTMDAAETAMPMSHHDGAFDKTTHGEPAGHHHGGYANSGNNQRLYRPAGKLGSNSANRLKHRFHTVSIRYTLLLPATELYLL